MVDNQHRKITGYRDLTEKEISQMNNIKEVGGTLESLILTMRAVNGLDQRWISIAETHFQEGLMAAVRSVARPNSF